MTQKKYSSPSLTLLSFKTRIEWPLVLNSTSISGSERILSASAIFKATSNHLGSQCCYGDKTQLTFPVFSLRFVGFAAEFYLCCKFSIPFHEKRPLDRSVTVALFSQARHNSLLRIATNKIASFCKEIDYRWRFFSVYKPFLFTKDFEIKKSFFSVEVTSVTQSVIASCATFLFLPHFDVICDLSLNRRTAIWNLFVKQRRNFGQQEMLWEHEPSEHTFGLPLVIRLN